jgi:hypothetical protein
VSSFSEKLGTAEISTAVDAILATPAFVKAPRMSKFLRFVVDQTLAKKGEELNEYLVAIEVFGQPEDFDPLTKRVIPPEARRLRRMLSDYYSAPEGVKNPVRVDIPTGTYMPSFSPNISSDKQKMIEAFREFFAGRIEAIKDDTARGVIIVQSDPMDELLRELLKRFDAKLAAEIKITSASRLFKAREWVNHWDSEGAQEIQEAFRTMQLTLPKIILRSHNSKKAISASAPFVISFGLGFTGRTATAIRQCPEWLRSTIEADTGDALWLHEKLIPEMGSGNLQFLPAVAGFRRLLPSGWDEKTKGVSYMEAWLEMRNDVDAPEVDDYAIIFRHTEKKGGRVLWVLAGYTERSTAIAARYLIDHWSDLWGRYLRDAPAEALGDFLVVIDGPSNTDPERLADWSEVLAVTPQRLDQADISCVWQRRLSKARSAPA